MEDFPFARLHGRLEKMAQEDQTHKSLGSGGSSSSSSSKKLKEKKVPQRGLGVAQLEKIRLEEQQKTVATSMLSPSPPPPSLLLPNYDNLANRSPSSSVPFPSQSAHHIVVKRPSYDPYQLANLAHHNAYEIPGNSKVPKVWNSCEYFLDQGENSPKLNPGLALNMNPPYEPNPIRPLSGLVQRTQNYEHVSPSMVNVPTPALLPPASNSQMEPPSNQSYYGNNALIWPEGEQMAGKKRSHAFLHPPPGPSFNLKFPTFSAQPRADGAASCGNGSAFNPAQSTPKLREGPCSYPASVHERNSESSIEENSAGSANFLTLSLPATATAASLSSKFNVPFSCLAFPNYEIPGFKTNPSQGIEDEPIFQPGLGRPSERPPFHSFLPPAKKQNCEAISMAVNNSSGGTGENVDLNLKL